MKTLLIVLFVSVCHLLCVHAISADPTCNVSHALREGIATNRIYCSVQKKDIPQDEALTGPLAFGTVCEFECYHQVTLHRLMCNSDGRWSRPEHMLQEDLMKCARAVSGVSVINRGIKGASFKGSNIKVIESINPRLTVAKAVLSLDNKRLDFTSKEGTKYRIISFERKKLWAEAWKQCELVGLPNLVAIETLDLFLEFKAAFQEVSTQFQTMVDASICKRAAWVAMKSFSTMTYTEEGEKKSRRYELAEDADHKLEYGFDIATDWKNFSLYVREPKREWEAFNKSGPMAIDLDLEKMRFLDLKGNLKVCYAICQGE